MKFFLLASFVILCTASTVYRSKNISVNDDGNILITSPSGKRIQISRQIGSNGQKNIDISISGPNIPTKVIQVNDNNVEDLEIPGGTVPYLDNVGEEYRLKRGSFKSQGDILAEILKEYQGVVTEVQYDKLLNKINKAVKKGEISPQIYDLLEGVDQQQQLQEIQGNLILGQSGQGQAQLYGLPSGLSTGYGYKSTVFVTPQGQTQVLLSTNQVPNILNTLGKNQYLTSTPNVNPLLIKLLPASQTGYIKGLLASQQLTGGLQGIVPQSSVLGTNGLLGQQLLGYQQIPFGQSQVPQVYQIQQTGQLGNPQIVGQLSGIPQTGIPQSILQQQQQQIQQLDQIEQAIEQLNEVQQQLQQQQQIGVQQAINAVEQLGETQQVIEQLNQIQQQQQQVAQIDQILQAIEQVNQGQQPVIGQLSGVSQPVGQQLLSQQPIIPQQQILGQLTLAQPTVGQLLGQQGQLSVQQQPAIGQLSGLPQSIVGQLGQQGQPLVQQQSLLGQLTGLPQPTLKQLLGQQGQLSGVSQPIVSQLLGQQRQQQQLTGISQPIVGQLLGQQGQPIVGQFLGQQGQQQMTGISQPIVGQLLGQQGQPIVGQFLGQQGQPIVQQLTGVPQSTVSQLLGQPIVQLQQTSGQLKSVPLTLQKLLGIPSFKGVSSYNQPILGSYSNVQPVTLQGQTGSYLNTLPQVQVY